MLLTLSMCLAAVLGFAPSGSIAYVSGVEQEDQCITILDLAANQSKRVGRGRRDQSPVWSADGAWLAFASEEEGKLGVWLVRPDGTELRQVSVAHGWNQWPRWSPDGRRIAYSGGDGFKAQLMVFDLETGVEEIWAGGQEGILQPVWTSPGELIVLAVSATDEPSLATRIHFASRARITPLPPDARCSTGDYVEWGIDVSSGRESKLAFESNDGGDREVFVITRALGCFDVSNHREADWNPKWSPDSAWLAFESFRSGRRGIYRAYPETVRVFPVAASEEHDNWAPAWSPDGKSIAFVSDRTGDCELYVTDVAGKEVRRLTDRMGPDLEPAWRPEPRQ